MIVISWLRVFVVAFWNDTDSPLDDRGAWIQSLRSKGRPPQKAARRFHFGLAGRKHPVEAADQQHPAHLRCRRDEDQISPGSTQRCQREHQLAEAARVERLESVKVERDEEAP